MGYNKVKLHDSCKIHTSKQDVQVKYIINLQIKGFKDFSVNSLMMNVDIF